MSVRPISGLELDNQEKFLCLASIILSASLHKCCEHKADGLMTAAAALVSVNFSLFTELSSYQPSSSAQTGNKAELLPGNPPCNPVTQQLAHNPPDNPTTTAQPARKQTTQQSTTQPSNPPASRHTIKQTTITHITSARPSCCCEILSHSCCTAAAGQLFS